MATEKAIPRMGTLKEAAALAGIPYSAIRKMCITGKVVHVRIANDKAGVLQQY